MAHDSDSSTNRQTRHKGVAFALVFVVAGMLGASFAAVPLYRLFCQVTGYGGTTQRATTDSASRSDTIITVRFDANTATGMPWQFRPKQGAIEVRLGETALAFYEASNPTGNRVSGTATFNVTPEIAGRFFNKLDCFCFTEQSLEAGESVEMPVSFYVDPAILEEPGAENVREITLSYTFFRADSDTAALQQPSAAGTGG